MKKRIIGRQEHIDLLDFNLENLTCKIDTGAYTGALHVDFIQEIEDEKVKFIAFGKSYTFPIYKQKLVKSSNGKKELRYFIKTNVIFMGKKYKISLSLTSRNLMKNPILIGRKFLNKRFLVDVSKKYTKDEK